MKKADGKQNRMLRQSCPVGLSNKSARARPEHTSWGGIVSALEDRGFLGAKKPSWSHACKLRDVCLDSPKALASRRV